MKEYKNLQIPWSEIPFATLQTMMTSSTIGDIMIYCCDSAFDDETKECRTTECSNCLFNPDRSESKEVFTEWLEKLKIAAEQEKPKKWSKPLLQSDFLDKMSKLIKEKR